MLIHLGSMVGMDAGSGEKMPRPACCKPGGGAAVWNCTAGNNKGVDACGAGAIYNLVTIVIEAVVRQVDSDVYQVHECAGLACSVTAIAMLAVSLQGFGRVHKRLIALPAKGGCADKQEDRAHQSQCSELWHDLGERGAVEHNGSCGVQHMGERKNLRNHLDHRV